MRLLVSRFAVKPTPGIMNAGTYSHRLDARPMQVYADLDFRLMFEDGYLKLGQLADWMRHVQTRSSDRAAYCGLSQTGAGPAVPRTTSDG